jgi:hypothetical protein
MVGYDTQKNLHGVAAHQRPAPFASAALFGELQYRAETSRAEEVDAAQIKYQWVTNVNEVREVVGDMLGIMSVNLAADFDNRGRTTGVTAQPHTEATTSSCDGGSRGVRENVMNGASHGNLPGRGKHSLASPAN